MEKNLFIKIHPLWYICITLRLIISFIPLLYNYFFVKNSKNSYRMSKLIVLNKYIILLIGLGFLYKSLFGSNNEFQIKKVFWHNTRIIHAILYLIAALNFHNYKFSSFILLSDVLFSIFYRFLNGI
uniref:Uncharacterized protein n=1 Tax=viral metagenome TaxID=1070528 RepID=A0A6C0LY46_9ZZZZ